MTKRREEKVKPNIFQTIHFWFFRKWYRIKMIPQEIRCFIQRGRRGFSYMDVQVLDFFLAKLISESIYELYRLEVKWRMDGTSRDVRLKTLKKISEGFKTYEDNGMDFEGLGTGKPQKSIEKKFQGALDLFVKNFGYLNF